VMGQASRQRAERLLTWDRSAQRLERVYLDLVNSTSSQRTASG
jgi:glycosyltransferase involved in cell wall biosynthesis